MYDNVYCCLLIICVEFGMKGEAGEKGEKGEAGSKGDKGDSGPSGTPGMPGSVGPLVSTFIDCSDRLPLSQY